MADLPLGTHWSPAREGRQEPRPSVVSQEGLDPSVILSAPLFFAAGMAGGPAVWRRPVKRAPCLPLRHHVTGSWDEGKAKAAGQKSNSTKAVLSLGSYEKPFGFKADTGKGEGLRIEIKTLFFFACVFPSV